MMRAETFRAIRQMSATYQMRRGKAKVWSKRSV